MGPLILTFIGNPKKLLIPGKIKDVADHMGHSSTRVTERYLHAADKNLAERVNSIDFAIA